MQEISSEREDADIREYLGICNAILMGELGQAGRDYLERLGFIFADENMKMVDEIGLKDLAKKFNIGYDPQFQDNEGNIWPAVIIPLMKNSYVAIDTRSPNGSHTCVMGNDTIFNAGALSGNAPVFVVDRVLDALAIINFKYQAVALCGADIEKLPQYIDKGKIVPKYPLLITLDNSGSRSEDIINELKNREIYSKKVDITGKSETILDASLVGFSLLLEQVHDIRDFKNAKSKEELDKKTDVFCRKYPARYENGFAFFSTRECLIDADILKVAEDFRKAILREIGLIQSNEENLKTRKAYLVKNAASFSMIDFKKSIKRKVYSSPVSTGFSKLDKELGGGFFPGLYIIGAISSLGKSAFVLQLADNIAKSGRDVLFFGLEMGKIELIARSLSRETFIWCGNDKSPEGIAKTLSEILNSECYDVSPESREAVDNAYSNYSKYNEHIFFLGQNDEAVTLADIRKSVEEHLLVMRSSPVLIVDYLQVIKSGEDTGKLSDKQLVDMSVTELKNISLKFNIPVIAVSSLNRASYSKEISFDAFKESGSIEYGCDVLIGLQFNEKSNINDAKRKEPRTIEGVILKQRNGPIGGRVIFSFYAKYNFFEEN